MSSDAVDLGLLSRVCADGLDRYNRIPVGGLLAEYNRRSVYPIGFISVKALESAMLSVPQGKIFYRRSAAPWGIYRNGF